MTYTVFRFKEIDSTNDCAKRMVEENVPFPFVVLSDEQTKGRGRSGRNFFSPKGGFYYTYTFEAKVGLEKYYESIPLTIIAAVATANAVEKVAKVTTSIKWVNDILLDGKKVGGILTEGIFGNQGEPRAVAIGIGINLRPQVFPEGIKDIATSLNWDSEDSLLVKEITENIQELLKRAENPEDKEEILGIYKEKCSTIGQMVSFQLEGQEVQGRALDLDNNGQLIVELEDNRRVTFFGEVTIKKEK